MKAKTKKVTSTSMPPASNRQVIGRVVPVVPTPWKKTLNRLGKEDRIAMTKDTWLKELLGPLFTEGRIVPLSALRKR
jgi:secreted protein with Ig-like and vWFA domain